MAGKIKIKRGTTAQWADSSTNDITLAPGQPGVEYCEDGKTKLKIGPHTEDGSNTEWDKIDYISAEGAEMVKTSTTGKNYTISDCAEETIVSLTGYGESTQDGTPTPDSPVEIVSVENPVISVYGKNLFDKDTMIISGAYVSGTGQYQTSASSEKTAIIPVPKNSTVTFSKIVTSILRVGLCTVYPTSGTQLVSFQDVSNKMSFTAATGNNSYLVAFFYNNSGETVNYEEAINSIQLEIGSSVTNYEPYTVQTVTVPHTFRGLKNTTTGQWSARDELRVGDGKVEIVRNVGTYTFNGTETWNLLTSETPSNIWTLHLQDKTIFAPNQYCLSSKLQGQVSASGKTYANNSIWLQNTDQFKRTYIALQGKWTSVVTAKQWLASNNIDIQYVNLTPEIEDITATEAGQALLVLKTNYPNTSVISDIDLNIEYLTVDSIVDQKYNPNSVYPQSGRAVAEAIRAYVDDNSGAGKKFGSSEVFNDYENNKTYSEGVKITNITDTANNSTFTLESVAGLAAGGTFNIAYRKDSNSNFDIYSMQFTIASIDTANKTITTTTKYSGPPVSTSLLYIANSTATTVTPLYVSYAHAEGHQTIARGSMSHAEGSYTTASGEASHAEGYETTASGLYSHAEGKRTTASGDCSHAEGSTSVAVGDNSHAQNTGTKTGYDSQTAMGKYNKNKSDTLLEVGNGTAVKRSNAFEVYKDGHVEAQTMGTTDTSLTTKQYVDDSINNATRLNWKDATLIFYKNDGSEVSQQPIKYAEDNNFIYVYFSISIYNSSIQKASVTLDITGISTTIYANNLSYNINEAIHYETFFAYNISINPSKILDIGFTDISNNIDFTGKYLSITGTYLFKK